MDGPNKTVEVTGDVSGGNGVSPPAPQMLKIMDDDGAPTVALVLAPARIGENGGVSTVTAALSGALGEPVTMTVSATAVSPAVAGDFELSANRELTIAPYFTDIDGDVLTYSAESSNPAAAVVAVNGSTLTLSAVVTGTATVTVTATDPEGLTATQVFAVAVGDRLVRAVLTDSLAALGRGHL